LISNAAAGGDVMAKDVIAIALTIVILAVGTMSMLWEVLRLSPPAATAASASQAARPARR